MEPVSNPQAIFHHQLNLPEYSVPVENELLHHHVPLGFTHKIPPITWYKQSVVGHVPSCSIMFPNI